MYGPDALCKHSLMMGSGLHGMYPACFEGSLGLPAASMRFAHLVLSTSAGGLDLMNSMVQPEGFTPAVGQHYFGGNAWRLRSPERMGTGP